MQGATTARDTSTPAPGDRVAALHSRVFVAGGAVLIALSALLQAANLAPSVAQLLPWLAALALVAGLPHGALDPWISFRAGAWTDWRGAARWHALYLVIAGGVVAFFVVAPTVALALFLLLAVVHFADDWNGEEEGFQGLPRPLRLLAGALIVMVPSVVHPEAVAAIFAAITRTQMNGISYAMPNIVMLPTLWIVSGTILAAWLVDRRAGREIAVVAGLAAVLPPLAFFLVYFAGLHSPRHMLREREAVPHGRGAIGVLGYTLLALALCVGVTLWAFEGAVASLASGLEASILRAVFIGLAALTVPHVLLVEGFGDVPRED